MSYIGILAGNRGRAEQLRRELELPEADIVSNSPMGGRGRALDLLLVDESAIPLDKELAKALTPAVVSVYALRRVTVDELVGVLTDD